MSENFEDLESWYLHLERIAEDNKRLSITKLLAVRLMNTPYMSVGAFLQGLSDEDLQTLVDLSEELGEELGDAEDEGLDTVEPSDLCQDLLLIAMMLSSAEGLPISTLDELQRNISTLTLFVAGASLHRKGLVEAFYENMSFSEDMNDQIIFKRVNEQE